MAWTVIYSGYLAYIFGTDHYAEGSLQENILFLGCQGVGVGLVLIANIFQILQGYSVFAAIRSYQEWVNDISIHKMQVLVLLCSSVGCI